MGWFAELFETGKEREIREKKEKEYDKRIVSYLMNGQAEYEDVTVNRSIKLGGDYNTKKLKFKD